MLIRHRVPTRTMKIAGTLATIALLLGLLLPWPRAAHGQSEDLRLECARHVLEKTNECYNEADGYFDRVKCELAEVRDLVGCAGIDWYDVLRQILKL